MHVPVTTVVRVRGGMDKGIVELSFADIGTEAVDILEGGSGVEADAVGPEAHLWAILLVEAPEFEMTVAFPGVIEHVGIREVGEEGAWVFGEGMEEEPVEDQTCRLCTC